MALVAYSDESDISENEADSISNELHSEILNRESSQTLDTVSSDKCYSSTDKICDHKIGILASIPQPNSTYSSVSTEADIVDDVPVAKMWNSKNILTPTQSPKNKFNKKSKLKLILPALSEFDDEDLEVTVEPSKPKMKPSTSGTGLFAILPKPQSTSFFVPNSVSKKTHQPTKKFRAEEANSVQHFPVIRTADSDDEGESLKTDFFSLSSQEKEPPLLPVQMPSFMESNLTPSNVNISSHPVILHQTTPQEEPILASYPEYDNVGPLTSPPDIDEEAIKRLGGRRNKEVPKIIDINADDALMNRDEWMNKVLTEEKPQMSFSKKKEGMPSHVQKRKHQITYLAHQAKEREQELMQTWGQNRLTKKQTQSKYGF